MEGFVIALFVCMVLALVSKYLRIPAIPFYILAGLSWERPGSGLCIQMRSASSFPRWG